MARREPTDRAVAPQATSAAVFLVLRRMRAPLIVLISTFSVCMFGMMLVPGTDADGKPWRMDAFDAFYFMSYTASTIGYGELPQTFSTQQRTWVTVSIYLTVIAWAYAIGTVFALLGDRGLREALASQRFVRQVTRMREPFLLIVGCGQAGMQLCRDLDESDRRLVVVDIDPERIAALDLEPFHSDVPGQVGDARDPHLLRRAGLDNNRCEGVVALTDDDEANLAVVMAASLLRPGISVVARTTSAAIGGRMSEFGDPMVVDPFNLFGDELALALRAPQTARLVEWLTSAPGTPLPPAPRAPAVGRWLVCGFGRFGAHLVADLTANGIPVTVVSPDDSNDGRSGADGAAGADITWVRGSPTDPEVLAAAGIGESVAFAATSGNDTTNISLVVAARRANPGLYVVSRQNRPANSPLFAAMDIDSVLVPTQLVAREVLARIGSPLMWRFVQAAQSRGEQWAAHLLGELLAGGDVRPDIWRVGLDADDAPALRAWLARSDAEVGQLLRDPQDRTQRIRATVLMLVRGGDAMITPAADTVLDEGDVLLFAGTPRARRALDTTLSVEDALAYVVSGRSRASSALWRQFAGRR